MNSQNLKVLVVDDDPFVSDMLGSILESSGCAVETAENGKEALKKHSASGVDLIISDMNMPEMNGLELIREIRKKDEDIPVIILTGNNEISVAIEAIRSGANDYLLKDENIQDTILLSTEKVWEKYQLKKKNQQLMAELALKNERLESEKALAQKVQKNILPAKLSFKGFDVETLYRPSDKIGGDFFDAWETAECIHFLIGDVSGHSTSAALIMAVCKGMLQSLGYAMKNPVEIIATANRMLCNVLSDSGMFISLVYGVFDRSKDELQIVSAGHNPVFLVMGDKITTIDSTGSVLGWDADDSWAAINIPFSAGASVVLYTDGLTEIKNSSREEFGEARLKELLRYDTPIKRLIEKILAKVVDFSGNEFSDDLTLLIIKRGAN